MRKTLYTIFRPLGQWRVMVIGAFGTTSFIALCADTLDEAAFLVTKVTGIVFGLVAWRLHKRWAMKGIIKTENDENF